MRSDRRGGNTEKIGSPLAAIQPEAKREPAAGGAKLEVKPRSLLVLDADPRTRALVEDALTAGGYRIASTGDPRTALRMARDEAADLVLTDIGMAVMDAVPRWERRRTDPDPAGSSRPISDGYAVLRALAMDPRAARYPAVFLKEDGRSGDRSQAYRFGVVDYVPKPVSPNLLLERVEEVFAALEAGADAPSPEPARPGPSSFTPPSPRWPEPVRRRPLVRSFNPAMAAEQVTVPAFEALPRGLRSALVVDTDEGSRRLIRTLLDSHGFTIYEASDGDEALRISLARRPWLIITEVNMPGIDGFEFCRRVRSHSLTRHTPLLFLSAWDDYRERYLGLKLGADDYVPKGTSPRELLIRIQLILKRYSDVGTRTRKGAGLEGGLDVIGAPGMLQMCHLGRFSGVCTARSETGRAQIRLRDGEIIAAESGRARGAEAVYEFLAWTEGHFEFIPGDAGEGDPLPESFDYLLLEGCRRLDEERRGPEVNTASDEG